MEARPRLLSPDEVKAFADVLRPLDEQELRRRFDHAAMLDADVYSLDVHEEDALEFVSHYVGQLRTFITAAADGGRGAVITIG